MVNIVLLILFIQLTMSLKKLAVQCFNTIGKKIKECRERDFKSNVMMATLNEGNFEDPAKADPELEKKLKENKKIAEARVAEVLIIVHR
jgi:hypothetical protein